MFYESCILMCIYKRNLIFLIKIVCKELTYESFFSRCMWPYHDGFLTLTTTARAALTIVLISLHSFQTSLLN